MPKTCHSFIACGERIAQKRSGHLQELVAGTQQPFCIASNFFFLTRLTTLNLEKPDCFFCFFRALSLAVQPRPGSRDICCEHQLALFLYALPGPQTQFPPPTMASFLYALQIHWYCGVRRENGVGARCALKTWRVRRAFMLHVHVGVCACWGCTITKKARPANIVLCMRVVCIIVLCPRVTVGCFVGLFVAGTASVYRNSLEFVLESRNLCSELGTVILLN